MFLCAAYVYWQICNVIGGNMISIIIPVYNCAKYLKRCVDSILEQPCLLECIIVDDGSTDGMTPALCEKLKNEDNRIRVIHKKNEGPVRAREEGIKIANGQYVMFVDSDDYLEREILSKCRRNTEETGADIVCFNYCLNEFGKIGFKIFREEVIDKTEAIRNMFIMDKMDGNMCYKLFRKELLQNIIWDTRRHCDFVNMYYLLKKAQIISIIPELGYHYSVIEGSRSRSNSCHPMDEEYEIAAYELYVLNKDFPQIKLAAESYWLYALLYVCIKMEKDKKILRSGERFRKIKKKIRKEIVRLYRNPYANRKEKLQWLLCYFNLFRPIYRLYALVGKKQI